jgi:L-alanine-DL-glutamate epimerase-like enolase superfamily enzyme
MESAVVELARVGGVAEIAKVVQLAQAEDPRVIPQYSAQTSSCRTAMLR